LHGIAGHFVTLQTPDHNPSKPHPGMMLRGMAETGAEARDTVIIGDTTFDIEMGKAAGTKAIGVTWGHHDPHELLAAGADILVETYADLPLAIKKVLED
jgi:phosphoglycolate phosphatase